MPDNAHNGHDHEHDEEQDESLEGMEFPFGLETASQVLIEMRAQNLELIKIAAQVAGYAGGHAPLKPNDLRHALSSVWEVYSQMYQWVDPEEVLDEEDGEDEEE